MIKRLKALKQRFLFSAASYLYYKTKADPALNHRTLRDWVERVEAVASTL